MPSAPLSPKWSSFRITAIYMVMGGAWILFSDKLLSAFIRDPAGMTRFQTYKGCFFIAATAWVLYLLIADYSVRLHRYHADLNKADAALREREVQLGMMVQQMGAILWTTDQELRFTWSQGSGLAALNLLPGQVVGQGLSEYFDAQGQQAPVIAAHRRALAGASATVEQEWGGLTFQCHIEPLRAQTGEIIGAIGVAVDITELKRAEEELLRAHAELEHRVQERTAELAVAKDRAEAADRVKSAFLATMSHELRTPLNSIIGFTGIMLQGLAGPLNSEQQKQMQMVRGSAHHLLALINDVLDISKIEAGQLEVDCEPFDLRASLEKTVAGVQPLAEKKGLTMQLQMSSELGTVVSDRRRVEQVVLNLLNNAIKFTESGSVTLTADLLPDFVPSMAGTSCAAAKPAVRIRVADTGIGIKTEHLKDLFQPFRQIETGSARQHEGTGLGLAICLRLAELLGAELQAESEWGKGSAFTFILPARGTRKS